MKQARQFITHKHIMIAGNVITSPSKLLTVKEEGMVGFVPSSSLASAAHPERSLPAKEEKKAEAKPAASAPAPAKEAAKPAAPKSDKKAETTKK